MNLRPARLDDAPACAAILGDFFQSTPWLPRLHGPAEDLAFVTGLIRAGRVTVARHHDVVGFLARSGEEVSHLYLAPHARGRGTGRRLMDHAKAGRAVLRLWCFQQNTPALAFYAAQGFVEVGRTDGSGNEERLPDVRLEWRRA